MWASCWPVVGESTGTEQEAGSIRGSLRPRLHLDEQARRQFGRIGTSLAHARTVRKKHRPYTHGLVLVIISLAVLYGVYTNGGFPGQSDAFAAPVTGLSLPGVGSSVPPSNETVLRPPAINRTLRAEQPLAPQFQEVAAQISVASATPAAESASQEDAVSRAAMVAPPPDLPPYQVYEVQDGDTVSGIASRFGILPEYVLANNPELHNADFLVLGQSIIIPAGNGVLHQVRYGETLSDIAARYDVDVESIVAFRSNQIDSADAIVESQLLYVPNARPELPAEPVAEPVPEAAPPGEAPAPNTGGGNSGAPAAPPPAGPSSSSGLIWPFNGAVSSYYGPGHPLGIDIDGFNNPRGAVVAATSGTVIFAGGNACCSYGLYVVILSPDGIETLYAHLSSISVFQGQQVSQGEVIGVVGNTGYSTGVHLHFEVIDNGVRVNPLRYLP